jgi:preprotein translocase subunit Sec63
MKLEEAASILGVSLEDVTKDGLKQSYKKLMVTWDPEKVSSAYE